MISKRTTELLLSKAEEYNQLGFIEFDPISIPHSYTKKQDIEITAFWSAVLSWGLRKTIIKKCKELFELMDNAPYDFIINHTEADLTRFLNFKHRTFNATDTLFFISRLNAFYKTYDSLENAFLLKDHSFSAKESLSLFHNRFFDFDFAPERTRKHIATPARKSACKRLNMFLRWMVRKDKKGVDFGIWNTINSSQLYCPLDVHVERVARKLQLLERKQSDWQAVEELTENLKLINENDPVLLDFALFGLGLEGY